MFGNDFNHWSAFKMTRLYDFFKRVKQRPTMYLPFPSITHLNTLLIGYEIGLNESGIDTHDAEFSHFQDWLHGRFNIEPSSCSSWHAIILFHSQNELTAFDTFFKLYEQFLEEEENKKLGICIEEE
jgi:hypothetical protein